MRALIAWFLVSLTWHTRPMYALLGDMCNSLAYQGTNPLRSLVNGLLFTLVGVLLFCLPLVGILTFPFTTLWLVTMNRKDWREIKTLTKAGRINWRTGTIADPQDKEAEATHE